MFPPETKTLVDTLPLPIQLMIYAVAFMVSAVGIWAAVMRSRKAEGKETSNVLIRSFDAATIADMKPLRDARDLLVDLHKIVSAMAADIASMAALQREVAREREDEDRLNRLFEKRAREQEAERDRERDRERDLKERPGQRR